MWSSLMVPQLGGMVPSGSLAEPGCEDDQWEIPLLLSKKLGCSGPVTFPVVRFDGFYMDF